jgi:hypothetical protein
MLALAGLTLTEVDAGVEGVDGVDGLLFEVVVALQPPKNATPSSPMNAISASDFVVERMA